MVNGWWAVLGEGPMQQTSHQTFHKFVHQLVHQTVQQNSSTRPPYNFEFDVTAIKKSFQNTVERPNPSCVWPTSQKASCFGNEIFNLFTFKNGWRNGGEWWIPHKKHGPQNVCPCVKSTTLGSHVGLSSCSQGGEQQAHVSRRGLDRAC